MGSWFHRVQIPRVFLRWCHQELVHVLTRKHVFCNHFRVKICTISDLEHAPVFELVFENLL